MKTKLWREYPITTPPPGFLFPAPAPEKVMAQNVEHSAPSDWLPHLDEFRNFFLYENTQPILPSGRTQVSKMICRIQDQVLFLTYTGLSLSCYMSKDEFDKAVKKGAFANAAFFPKNMFRIPGVVLYEPEPVQGHIYMTGHNI